MNSFRIAVLCALTPIIGFTALAQTAKPTPEEKARAEEWTQANLGPDSKTLPFSFSYNGQSSTELLKNWKSERSSKKMDEYRTQTTLKYSDPRTGLEVRCEIVHYQDYPTVEWTLYFKNKGENDTPVLADIQALDCGFERGKAGEFILHHQIGSPCQPNDYQPFASRLGSKVEKRITTAGGRPTNSDLPYFNLEWSGEGVIVVIGWPGQWAARFTRDAARGLRVRGGQELTHFKLHAGEEVRSPLIVLQFWKGGDWIEAQNVWRRWMIAHNIPRPGGQLPVPIFAPHYPPLDNFDEKTVMDWQDRYQEEQIKPNYWWVDAGWYPCNGSWPKTGTWEADRKRLPGGLRAISDRAHSRGMKLVVWFEPERVAAGTWLSENHPEWILGGAKGGLLNLGHPEAHRWLVDHIDKLLTDEGIDVYRQDFNMDPLRHWRANDAEDRQGITEIRHVEGYLAYWDELLRRHPDLLIDSCASGGRRNDLETLRRAAPLYRSDYIHHPLGNQNHTYGIALWIPFYGAALLGDTEYAFRSNLCPSVHCHWDMKAKGVDYDFRRRMVDQWREVTPNFYGDYYPLTSYSLEKDAWMAWQFHRPEVGAGMVQVFKREESPFEMARFKLRGLKPDVEYRLTDLDTRKSWNVSGRELMEQGLPVNLTSKPQSAIVTYKRSS